MTLSHSSQLRNFERKVFKNLHKSERGIEPHTSGLLVLSLTITARGAQSLCTEYRRVFEDMRKSLFHFCPFGQYIAECSEVQNEMSNWEVKEVKPRKRFIDSTVTRFLCFRNLFGQRASMLGWKSDGFQGSLLVLQNGYQ